MRGALLLLLVGCSGRVTAHAEDRAPEAAAGNTTVADQPAAGGESGTGGTPFIPIVDGPSPKPELCPAPAPACRIKDTYVEIGDEPPARLAVPYDSTCTSCWVPCEDCSFECELSAFGVTSCGSVSLRLSACAGSNQTPPCLNMAADQPYYVDGNGETWGVVALEGQAPTQAGPTLLDANLTLILQNGTTTREVSAHVRACADVNATLRPCK